MIAITSIDELKKLASGVDGIEAVIMLNYGIRSTKHIWFRKNRWTVFNMIDDSAGNFKTDADLDKGTNIVRAIKLGSLLRDDEPPPPAKNPAKKRAKTGKNGVVKS